MSRSCRSGSEPRADAPTWSLPQPGVKFSCNNVPNSGAYLAPREEVKLRLGNLGVKLSLEQRGETKSNAASREDYGEKPRLGTWIVRKRRTFPGLSSTAEYGSFFASSPPCYSFKIFASQYSSRSAFTPRDAKADSHKVWGPVPREPCAALGLG